MRSPLALVAFVAASASCYEAPRPACGFWCGPNNECPGGYLCNSFDGRCYANGIDPADVGMPCPDAGDRPARPDTTRPRLFNVDPGCDGDGEFSAVDPSCVRAYFDEPVFNVTSSTLYVLDDYQQLLENGTVRVVSEGAYAEIDYPFELPSGRTYTLYASDEIRDIAGNRVISEPYFFFVPSSPPLNMIVGHLPVAGTTGVSVFTNVEAIYQSVISLDETNFLLQETFSVVPATVTQLSPESAILDPIDQLRPDTQYTVSAPNLAVPWTFSTGADFSPPNIRVTVPVDGSVDVPAGDLLRVTFDEQVMPPEPMDFVVTFDGGMSVAGTAAPTGFDNSWIFDPSAPLMPGTLYTVQVTATDTSNNSATYSWSFTTAP